MFWTDVRDGYRGDTGGPGLPDCFQHSGGCSGKLSPVRSM